MSAPLRNQWRPSAKSEASVSVLQRNHRGYCARLRCWRFLERAQSSHWRHERVTERQSASDPAPPIICCENLLRWLILVCLALFWTVDTKCSEFCSRDKTKVHRRQQPGSDKKRSRNQSTSSTDWEIAPSRRSPSAPCSSCPCWRLRLSFGSRSRDKSPAGQVCSRWVLDGDGGWNVHDRRLCLPTL